MKNPDHRVVFITAALFSVPIAAFYPFTPPHLRELGMLHSSAWMALGQVTEIIALFGLAHLLGHWRLKWVFGTGIAFGVIRFACCAVGTKPWLLTGIILHGFSFALFFITCQIYLDERVPSDWRARAQALLALITGGVGNLTGYLSVGWWHRACTELNVTRWPLFWGVLSAASAVVLVYFLTAYHGRGVPPKKVSPAGTLPPEA